MWTRSPRPRRPMDRTRSARVAAPGGTAPPPPASLGGAAVAAAGGSNSLTGTVLERCRKPLPAWVSFIRPMCLNAPVECTAELCGVTHKTAFEWRHRVLVTVSGYWDRIVLRDTVWVGESYINDTASPRATGSLSSAVYPTSDSASASPSTFK